MTNVERLLLETMNPGLVELSKRGIGLYDAMDEDGIHYLFDGESYLITVKKEEDEYEKRGHQ